MLNFGRILRNQIRMISLNSKWSHFVTREHWYRQLGYKMLRSSLMTIHIQDYG